MTRCQHEAWEELPDGERWCSDCKVRLGPRGPVDPIVLIDPLPQSRFGFAFGTAKTIAGSRHMTVEDHPRVFNGEIALRRFRITVEVVNEPIDVLRDRLRALWRESEPNIHTRQIFRKAANELGIDLKDRDQGADHRSRDPSVADVVAKSTKRPRHDR